MTASRIVDEAIADDPRIRLVRSAQNSGPAAARNKALALARGDWIAVMDSDDLMHPDRLKRLIAAAERDGADIVADDLIEFESDVRAVAAPALRKVGARPILGRYQGDYVQAQYILRHRAPTRVSETGIPSFLAKGVCDAIR